MDILNYWPYVGLAFLALAVLICASILLVIYHKSVVALLKTIFGSQVGFFYVVLFTFMVVSVTESGDFFNKAITHGVFGGTLGYAVATVFDLFSLVCMIARMNASRIADKRGEWLALVGVVVCAGVSAFANVASAVQDYQINQFSQIPPWMQSMSPYIGLVFPGMIVIVTLIADHIGDLNPQRADSVATYRDKEQKKVDLLRVRLEIEKDKAKVQREMYALHGKHSKKDQRAFALALEEAKQEHQKIVADLQTKYDAHIDALNEQLASLNATLQASLTTNIRRRPNVASDVASSDARTSLATSQVPTPERQTDEIPVVGNNDAQSDGNSAAKMTQKKPTPLFGRKRENPALRKVRNLKKRYPDMGPTDLAKKAGLSRSYVSDLLKQLEEVAV